MKSIRVSDGAYDFLKKTGDLESRSITKTLDVFIQLFIQAENELAEESISSSIRETQEEYKLAKNKKKDF